MTFLLFFPVPSCQWFIEAMKPILKATIQKSLVWHGITTVIQAPQNKSNIMGIEQTPHNFSGTIENRKSFINFLSHLGHHPLGIAHPRNLCDNLSGYQLRRSVEVAALGSDVLRSHRISEKLAASHAGDGWWRQLTSSKRLLNKSVKILIFREQIALGGGLLFHRFSKDLLLKRSRGTKVFDIKSGSNPSCIYVTSHIDILHTVRCKRW